MLILAENFEQDVGSTAADRYPGSTYALGAVPVPASSFPLNSSSVLEFGAVPFTAETDRLEVFLRLETAAASATATDRTWSVFGIPFGAPYTAETLTVAGHAVAKFDTAQTLNLIIERSGANYLFSLFIDDVRVLRKAAFFYEPTSWIGASYETNTRYEGLPTSFSEVAVVRNGNPDVRMSGLLAEVKPLTLVSAGDWSYTDQGYVQDVDKAGPLVPEPNIYASEYTEIEYQVDDSAELTNVYVGAATEQEDTDVVVNNVRTRLSPSQKAAAISTTTGSIVVRSDEHWLSNGQGLEYAGESDLISYRDLETELVFTAGEANPENTWLRVRLDGVEMYVAKTPLRHSLSWDQIYAAGLVYGTDDVGLNPVGTPTNQLRIVTISGVDYAVRLLKGADTDPVNLRNSGNDVVGTRESEWSRIFYPLCSDDPNVTSYTGPKLAEFTMADLWMLDAAAYLGRYSWCQETLLDYPVNRVIRGLRGPSRFTRTDSTSTVTACGWRPVLERIT